MIATLLLAAAAMTLSSADFSPGGTIPVASMSTDCGGRNRTPSLRWSGAPAKAQSFALIVRDPDAPVAGGFYHWIVYDIPASANELSAATLKRARTGVATTGLAAYYGPCPPPGPAHHYVFTLYALDVARLDADTPLSAQQLQRRIQGHVLASATLAALETHR
jgi:Raf kinase inhibitor-like YbhB/YbcL family protein